jgi:hypothetical protein
MRIARAGGAAGMRVFYRKEALIFALNTPLWKYIKCNGISPSVTTKIFVV